MPDFKAIVSRRLRVRMAEKNMNAAQVAAKAGLSADSVRKYRRGEMLPSLDTIYKLAEALDCSPNNLCAFDLVEG